MTDLAVDSSSPLADAPRGSSDGRGPAAARTLRGNWLGRWALANLAAQVGIVVTGGLVRVTGSGLGCPTWPECFDGSLTPPRHAATGSHAAVEFGNRMLTFVLTAVAVALVVTVVRQRRRSAAIRADRRLLVLALVPFLGIVAQAVLGGVTVLVDLSPAWVAAHLLLSMVLISASTWLVVHLQPRQGWAGAARREVRIAGACLALLTGAVLVLGTVVTGAGPHAGDELTPRYDLDIRAMTWLHADAVLVLGGLALVLMVATRLLEAPRQAQRWCLAVVGVCAAQSLVGYVQYATGVPWGLVLAHLLGASLLVVAVTGALLRTWETPAAG
ncbi:MAG: COX15/CtaA family protein [Kineosporiaceae bacterium]